MVGCAKALGVGIRAMYRAPPGASTAQHPAFPSPSLAAVVWAGSRLLFPPPLLPSKRGEG